MCIGNVNNERQGLSLPRKESHDIENLHTIGYSRGIRRNEFPPGGVIVIIIVKSVAAKKLCS